MPLSVVPMDADLGIEVLGPFTSVGDVVFVGQEDLRDTAHGFEWLYELLGELR